MDLLITTTQPGTMATTPTPSLPVQGFQRVHFSLLTYLRFLKDAQKIDYQMVSFALVSLT